MDAQGFVGLGTIAGFQRVRLLLEAASLGTDAEGLELVRLALADDAFLELSADGLQVRLRDAWQYWIWKPEFEQPADDELAAALQHASISA